MSAARSRRRDEVRPQPSIGRGSWRRRAAGLLALGSLLVPACSASGTASADRPSKPLAGHVVAAGGAVDRENSAIYGTFLAHAALGKPIGVIGAASAESAEAAERAMTALRLHDAQRELVALDLADADAPELAARIRACGGLWICGGDQSRVTALLLPDGRETAAYVAVRALLASGGVVGGTSAGAALMSDPMLTGGRSEGALAAGVRLSDDQDGVGLGRGLGLFPYGLVDQHFLQRGRLGRLIVALRARGIPRGYGVDEDGALHADLATGLVTALGPASLLVVDVERVREADGDLHEVRLHLLGSGDLVDREGLPRPAAARTPRAPDPAARAATPLDPWGRAAVLEGLERLARDPTRPVRAVGERFTLELSADACTRFLGTAADPCALGVRLDVLRTR